MFKMGNEKERKLNEEELDLIDYTEDAYLYAR
jgi:hypothetical protein